MRDHENLDGLGDMDFILCLYQEFKPLMFATARKYLANIYDQEDVVQASLIKLIEKVCVLRNKERSALCSYIVYTVKNTALNYLKHQNVITAHSYSMDDSISEIPSDAPPLEELIELADRRKQLFRIWDKLPEIDQVLLESKYVLGQSDQQLAGTVFE
ncbi:MAG: sigma-70 family RNA polymerase sigma factor [Oscillospiraceae bacterium]|nr:sigma-70 family RNA polymerase sigma factor [Oscillospiraceae bacterium]